MLLLELSIWLSDTSQRSSMTKRIKVLSHHSRKIAHTLPHSHHWEYITWKRRRLLTTRGLQNVSKRRLNLIPERLMQPVVWLTLSQMNENGTW